MGQSVNVPGVGLLQFPDGMSQDDMSAAIQRNYPQIHGPASPHPDDSPFVKGIKDFGNETVRVGAKAITGLPLMAADFATGVKNLGNRLAGGNESPYPSDIYQQQLDQGFAPPTNTRGKISEGLSTLIASLGLPGPTGVRTAGDMTRVTKSLTGADAVKAEAMAQARNNGVVIPPTLTKDAPVGANLKNGWGGLTETLRQARDVNTPAINGLLAKDIGLDAGSPLTVGDKGTVTGQITDAIKAGYDPLRSIGNVKADQVHEAFIQALAQSDRGAANVSPTLGNPDIAKLADAVSLKSGPKDAGDLVDAISALRAKATDAGASGNKTLAAAYRKAAGGFEALLDRHLQAQGDPASAGLLTNYRLARTRIAKGSDLIDALNPATGDVDPRLLAGLDQSKLTGGTKTAATIARAFPKAVAPSEGTPAGVTAFQANEAPEAIAQGPSGAASVLAGVLLRKTARNSALSKATQAALMQPRGKTLSNAALNAVFANPAAFSALYEDSTH